MEKLNVEDRQTWLDSIKPQHKDLVLYEIGGVWMVEDFHNRLSCPLDLWLEGREEEYYDTLIFEPVDARENEEYPRDFLVGVKA